MEGFTQASVTRADNQLTIAWEGAQLGRVKVYQAYTPDFTEDEGALVAETNAGSVVWDDPDPAKRPYFCLLYTSRCV